MSKAVPGRKYTVQSGDSLSRIASDAYGDSSKWPIIFNANQKTLKTDDPNKIFPGEILNIPELKELKSAKEDIQKRSGDEDDFQIEIGGRIIPIVSGEITRTMDTAADGWSAVIAWEPGRDEFIDRVTRPFSYEPARAYIGGERVVTGLLFFTRPQLNKQNSKKDLKGFSATVNIVDSNIRVGDLESNNISLKERAEKLLEPYGLKVFTTNNAAEKASEKFDRVTAEKSEKIFSHLAKLAAQKQLLISSTEKGNLLLTRANTSSRSIGTIEEDLSNSSLVYEAEFDGRKRFSSWRVDCQTPNKIDKKNATAKDPRVPISRHRNITVNNENKGSIERTAEWFRSKEFSEALKIDFPVPTFYGPDGNIWRENTKVTVVSETIGVPEGFTFLINKVKFRRTKDGDSAVLSLIPEQVYTGEEIEEPWSEE